MFTLGFQVFQCGKDGYLPVNRIRLGAGHGGMSPFAVEEIVDKPATKGRMPQAGVDERNTGNALAIAIKIHGNNDLFSDEVAPVDQRHVEPPYLVRDLRS